MAQVIWTEPALQELDAIAEYIALDNPVAASDLVRTIFNKIERLADFPRSGRIPPELGHSVYREIVVPPCRIFYREDGERFLSSTSCEKNDSFACSCWEGASLVCRTVRGFRLPDVRTVDSGLRAL